MPNGHCLFCYSPSRIPCSTLDFICYLLSFLSMFRADEIKALLFDTFGTVVDWRSSLIDAFSQFGQRHQLAGDWSQLVDQWRATCWPSMDKVRKGELAWTTLDELHRAANSPLRTLSMLGQQVARHWSTRDRKSTRLNSSHT